MAKIPVLCSVLWFICNHREITDKGSVGDAGSKEISYDEIDKTQLE